MVVKGALKELAVSGLNISSNGALSKTAETNGSLGGCVLSVDQKRWPTGEYELDVEMLLGSRALEG
jgi:hypothetical protein